jgi:hypothetical protein
MNRSVHNTRIERLWYDVTHSFGHKWKLFFLELELHHHLNPQIPSHIWLLHHLFLHCINEDAQEWAQSWNSHPLEIRGERNRSPHDIFLFSMIQDGPRGIQRLLTALDEDVDDLSAYGVDWEDMEDAVVMNHLLDQNPQDWDDENPFTTAPSSLSEVICEPPNCPFTSAQVDYLDRQLALRVDVGSRNMNTRRLVWLRALELCHEIFGNNF